MVRLGLIEKLPILPHMSFHTKLVRRRAPRYIKSVIEDSNALPNADHIEELRPEHFNALSGGQLSATYLVKSPPKQVVIKLNTDSVYAEAEALEIWKQHRVRAPKVLAYGVVPISRREPIRVKYMIQEAVVDENGRISENAASYLLRRPERARAVGRALGIELTKMHRIKARRTFGDYADSPGNTAPFRTWAAYVMGYIDMHEKYLRSLELTADQLAALRHFIDSHDFTRTPRYLHGDFGIRNSLIASYDPLKLVIFDPNPLIGDPSWDIAVVLNNYEYQRRRFALDEKYRDLKNREMQVWLGFKQAYKLKIDEASLQLSQMIHAIFQIGYENGKKKWRGHQTGLQAYEGMIYDLARALAKRGEEYAASQQ